MNQLIIKNRDVILNRANEYYKNNKEVLNRANEYYKNNKEVLKEKARNKYRELSEEEKYKKRVWMK